MPGQPPLYPGAPSVPSYPEASTVQVRICCISLNESDKIRLIAAPPDLTLPIREAIKRSWGTIQRERNYNGAHEFKVLGNPWSGNGAEAVTSRKLITAILRTMIQYGWNLIQATDISKKEHDKDTLFFESTTIPDPGQVELFSVSFNRTDRIRLIEPPAHIIAVVKGAIQSVWKRGISQEQVYCQSHEFKLNGNPFWADGEETVSARIMLAQVLAVLRSHGYKLYTSVDISMGNDGHDVETWIMRRVGPTWS
ncbi:hypothetical protein BGZ46_002889 [Entomortierella lignicola]|nr:hypothetical protein BGZ46_002889 [Entomortierella lignicola]